MATSSLTPSSPTSGSKVAVADLPVATTTGRFSPPVANQVPVTPARRDDYPIGNQGPVAVPVGTQVPARLFIGRDIRSKAVKEYRSARATQVQVDRVIDDLDTPTGAETTFPFVGYPDNIDGLRKSFKAYYYTADKILERLGKTVKDVQDAEDEEDNVTNAMFNEVLANKVLAKEPPAPRLRKRTHSSAEFGDEDPDCAPGPSTRRMSTRPAALDAKAKLSTSTTRLKRAANTRAKGKVFASFANKTNLPTGRGGSD